MAELDHEFVRVRRQQLADAIADVPGVLPRAADLHPDHETGQMLLPRLLQDRWIRRRVEKTRFTSPSRIRRQVSLDLALALSHDDAEGDSLGRTPWLVPLGYLPKTNDEHDQNILRDFDARDEAGHAVPILGRRENTRATWSVLVVAANRAVGQDGGTPLKPLEDDVLWAFAASPARHAMRLRRVLGTLAPADQVMCPTLARAISEQSAYTYLLDRLAEDYMLLADLRGGPVPARGIIKYAYDTSWPDRSRQRMTAGLGRFGIRATPVMLALASPLPSQGYHFEFEAPDGLEVVGCRLRAQLPLPGGDTQARSRTDARIADHRTLTHVHLDNIRPGESLAAVVALKAVRSSELVMAVVGGALLAAGLLAGSIAAELVVHNRSSVASLALLLPGLLAGTMLARHSHDVVGRLGWGLRLLTSLIVLLSVAAVMSVAATMVFTADSAVVVDDSETRLRAVWRVLCVVSVVVTMMLLPSLRPYERWDVPEE